MHGYFAGTPQLDYEAWTALIRSGFGGEAKATEPNAFTGWNRPLSVFGLAASEHKTQCGSGPVDLGSDAYRFERTANDVRCTGVDNYYVMFQQAGRMALAQNDQAVELAAGDFALIDMSRPLSFFCNNSNQRLAVNLPRQQVLSRLGFEPQGGWYAHGRTPAARVLWQLVRDGVEDEASLSGPARVYTQLVIYDLLGAMFSPSDPLPISNHTGKLFGRACDVIRHRFSDPELSPAEVAAEIGISLRYLQKLFTAQGSTCTRFIQTVRLDHAAHLLRLRASLHKDQPLGEIAYACGYSNYNHFLRHFGRRFGRSPRQFKK